MRGWFGYWDNGGVATVLGFFFFFFKQSEILKEFNMGRINSPLRYVKTTQRMSFSKVEFPDFQTEVRVCNFAEPFV